MYRVFEHSQVVLSGFQCMYAIHEASLQFHELYCDESIIALIRLSSTSTEIRNYLVANPIERTKVFGTIERRVRL